jgi:hypothetical protein
MPLDCFGSIEPSGHSAAVGQRSGFAPGPQLKPKLSRSRLFHNSSVAARSVNCSSYSSLCAAESAFAPDGSKFRISHPPWVLAPPLEFTGLRHISLAAQNCTLHQFPRFRTVAPDGRFRAQHDAAADQTHHTVSDLSYAGDEGGIVCHMAPSEAGGVLVVSLTQVRVPRSMPLAAAVTDY